MQQEYTILSNGSWLSLAHANLLSAKIQLHFPQADTTIVTEAEAEAANRPIDFTITTGENIEKMGVFLTTPHAFLQRGNARSVAFFNKNILLQILDGATLRIAAGNDQQHTMLKQFLQKALPSFQAAAAGLQVITSQVPIEDNLLNSGYDGVVVPLAHINTILADNRIGPLLQQLLQNKKMMVLPLFECPPAMAQACIAISAGASNTHAAFVLEQCENDGIAADLHSALDWAATLPVKARYGLFCMQTATTTFKYAAGINADGKPFSRWDFPLPDGLDTGTLFSSTDYMKDFFSYRFVTDAVMQQNKKAVFISSHKAIHCDDLAKQISEKRVWAAGTRTWYELAKSGIWVEGCADGLGLETLLNTWQSPAVALDKKEVQIITNTASAVHWVADGWDTAGTYELVPEPSAAMEAAISGATHIFWTSFQQYEMYKAHIQAHTKHMCPAGKTAKLLLALGLEPIIFPTIKAFLDWRSAAKTKDIKA